MSDLSNEFPTIFALRKIASEKLTKYAKVDPAAIRETFLFASEHYVGVRLTLGQFSLQWSQPETQASICRGNLVIETVHLASQLEIKRAA